MPRAGAGRRREDQKRATEQKLARRHSKTTMMSKPVRGAACSFLCPHGW